MNSEVNRLFGDNTKLHTLTDWTPQYSGIDGFRRGIINTVKWFESDQNMSYYRPCSYTI